MRCEQFERRLQEVLDDRSSPELDETLRGHAVSCSECRELLATYESLLSTVAQGWVPRGSRRLTSAVVAEWDRTLGLELVPATHPRRLRGWQMAAGSIACAAALLIAILPLLLRDQSSDPAVVASHEKNATESAQNLAIANELRPEQLGAVAHDAGRNLAMLVLQFPDYETSAGPNDEGAGQASWLRPVTSSLKPFSSVGEPFNVLLRATGTRGGQAHSS